MLSEKSLIHWTMLVGFAIGAFNLVAADIPSPALLVVIKGENALAIVDPQAKKVVGRVPVGAEPHEVVVSPDGKFAYVSNHGPTGAGGTPGTTISVIDIAAQKELRRIDLGARSRPHGLLFTGGKLYFTAEGNKLIGCYNPATDQIEWRVGTGQNRTHMMVISKDLNRIFTSNVESDTITALERVPEPTDWNVTVIHVGRRPEGIDMSPDGKEVWTAHIADGGVSIIDTASKKVTQTLALGLTHPIRLKFTLDGKRVLINDDKGNALVMLDAATHKEIKRMNPGNSPEGMMISPDGAYAYVAVTKDNNLAIIDTKTLELVGRIPTGPTPDGMAWVERH